MTDNFAVSITDRRTNRQMYRQDYHANSRTDSVQYSQTITKCCPPTNTFSNEAHTSNRVCNHGYQQENKTNKNAENIKTGVFTVTNYSMMITVNNELS